MARIKKFLKENAGTATVEMAVVLTLLLTITFGAMEYGWVFYRLQQVNNIAREAARTGALADMGNADIQNRVDFLMGQWGLDSVAYSTQIYPNSVFDAPVGTPVSVTINVSYSEMELIGFVPTPAQLTSTATMAKEN